VTGGKVEEEEEETLLPLFCSFVADTAPVVAIPITFTL